MPPVTSCYLEDSEQNQVHFDTVFTAEFYGKLCALMRIEETAATLAQLNEHVGRHKYATRPMVCSRPNSSSG